MSDYISYNGLPIPLADARVVFNDEVVKTTGDEFHFDGTVSVLGFITGSSYSGVASQKATLIQNLTTGFKTLDINSGDIILSYAKPMSINFNQGNMSRFLGFEIEFAVKNTSSGDNFGVTDISDAWSFSESNGNITASHTVSAKGNNVSTGSPYSLAKAFVLANTGFYPPSSFYTEYTGDYAGNNFVVLTRKTSKSESAGTYGVETQYLIDNSNIHTGDGVMDYSVTTNLGEDGKVTASLKGKINFGLGVTGSESDFTPEEAKAICMDEVIENLSSYETGNFDLYPSNTNAYEYSFPPKSNSMEFSFSFTDLERELNSGILNSYSVATSASKDDGVVTVNVNGTITDETVSFNALSTGENAAKLSRITNFYETGVDAFGLAFSDFLEFTTGNEYTNTTFLNPEPVSSSVTINPNDPNLSYQFSFNNKLESSTGDFKNISLSITDSPPTGIYSVVEGLNNYIPTLETTKRLGSQQFSLSAEIKTGVVTPDVSSLESFISGYLQNGGELQTSSKDTGRGSVSLNSTYAYK